MSIIRIDFHPSRRQLAGFGLIWLTFFAVLGGIVLCRGGSWAAVTIIWTLAAVVPAVGWLLPPVMRIVYVTMACAAFPVGLVLGQVALASVYYLVLTPTGLALRALGYDPMSRGFDAEAETYWTRRACDKSADRCFRQF
jgi:hypothetical protein